MNVKSLPAHEDVELIGRAGRLCVELIQSLEIKTERNGNQIMTREQKNKILTIPNILSFFRLCLIPVFVWLYRVEQSYSLAGGVLLLSGLTDVMDGRIARKYNSITNFGKALDPIADKLTQAMVLFCLVARFPFMMWPLIVLVLKEVFAGITSLLVIHKTEKVMGADWHGKVSTFLLYAMMIIHVVWFDISPDFSDFLVVVNLVMMIISFVLYAIRNIGMLLSTKTYDDYVDS